METPWIGMNRVYKTRMGPCGSHCGNQSCQHHLHLVQIFVQSTCSCSQCVLLRSCSSHFDVIQLDKCVGRVPQTGPIFLCPKFQTLRSGMSPLGLHRPNSHHVELNVELSSGIYIFIIEDLMWGPVFWSRYIIN